MILRWSPSHTTWPEAFRDRFELVYRRRAERPNDVWKADHTEQPLTDDELAFVLTRHWRRIGLTLDLDDFTDAQAVAAVSRITRGNFRLLHRLFTQIERILKINGLSVITNDVIEAARSTLVIGAE